MRQGSDKDTAQTSKEGHSAILKGSATQTALTLKTQTPQVAATFDSAQFSCAVSVCAANGDQAKVNQYVLVSTPSNGVSTFFCFTLILC